MYVLAEWNVNATFFLVVVHSQSQWNAIYLLLSFHKENKHKRLELCEYVIISHIVVIIIVAVVGVDESAAMPSSLQ